MNRLKLALLSEIIRVAARISAESGKDEQNTLTNLLGMTLAIMVREYCSGEQQMGARIEGLTVIGGFQ